MNALELLKKQLNARKMTLYSFSRASGISYSTFDSAKKRGGQMALDTIEIICQTLNIPPYQFFMTDKDWEDLRNYSTLKESKPLA